MTLRVGDRVRPINGAHNSLLGTVTSVATMSIVRAVVGVTLDDGYRTYFFEDTLVLLTPDPFIQSIQDYLNKELDA